PSGQCCRSVLNTSPPADSPPPGPSSARVPKRADEKIGPRPLTSGPHRGGPGSGEYWPSPAGRPRGENASDKFLSPCEPHLSQALLAILTEYHPGPERLRYMMQFHGRPPAQPPPLREMVRALAQLGGFLARAGDGEPGIKSIWQGYQRLHEFIYA